MYLYPPFPSFRPMEQFKCFYCGEKSQFYEHIVNHTITDHSTNVLKYRQGSLDESSGILKYQTKSHPPAHHQNAGRILMPHNDRISITNSTKRKKS